MHVRDCMIREVRIVDPEETLREAAMAMADMDAGFLPVGENDRMIGILTDRDITIRGVANGLTPDAHVRDVMTGEVLYCFDDDDAEDVLNNMAEIQVRRMPVLDHGKRLVGVVSITDLAGNGQQAHAGEALSEIARPSLVHSQTL